MLIVLVFVGLNQTANGQSLSKSNYYTSHLQGDEAQNVASLKSVLKKVEKSHNITFFYDDRLVENKFVAVPKMEADSLAHFLGEMLSQKGLTYQKQTARTYVIMPRSAPPTEEVVQQEPISGTVTDAESGETLPGVNILVKGTTTGASTDQDGNFEFEVPSLQDTLVVTYIGYQRQEVPIDGRTELDIQLTTEAVMGEEMVVVGYGTQKRENLTGAVQSISGSDLAEQPAIQPSSALQGIAPGVAVQQNSGQPGQNQGSIRIRGVGTLGDSNPLVLIDGVEGDMDNIASSDIENMTVLKDASSAAIYGSRAANGVILVTTKRGQEGIQVNYNSRFGTQQSTAGHPEYVDGGEFMRLENLGNTNIGNQPIWSQQYIEEWEANHATNPDEYPNTDWVNEVFSETAYETQHSLSVSGGSENINYRGSLQYDDETAEIPNFRFQKYSIRLNTNITVSDKIGFKVDLNTVRSDQTEPNSSLELITRQVHRLAPIFISQYSNGGFGPGRNGKNPYAHANAGGLNTNERSDIRGRLRAEYSPTSDLSFNLTYAPDYASVFSKEMNKQYQVFDPETDELLYTTPARNSLSQGYNRTWNHNINFTGNYQRDLKNHSFSVLGGYEFISSRNDYFNASRDNFLLQDFEQLNVGSENNQQNSGSASAWALQSLFSRVNYSYKDKYLLETNLRYDGSSRFTEKERWGIFPSFSGGWVISEEPFMESVNFVSQLKVRGSWGQLGNQNIGNYPYSAVINLGQNYLLGGGIASGAAQTSLANPAISWEKTTTTGFGIDLSLLDNSINLKADWFKRMTDDILLTLPIPQIIGLNAPYQNAGSVENTGWEAQLEYNDNIGSDFTYSASFNVSSVNNKVTDLKGAGPFINGNTIVKEGSPINSIYGYEADGLFHSQGEIDNHATQTGQIAPGDIKYVDQPTIDTDGDGISDDTDGVINADDRVVIGNPFPDFNYGINLSGNYKNLDISVLFQGVGSRDVFLQQDAVWALYNAGKVTKWQADQYWTPEQPDNDYPRLTTTTAHNNFETSSYWVYDASYIRLRNLQIGYTIPTNWSNKISAKGLRVYFVGQNLLTLFDNMPPGIDPNIPNSTVGSYFPIQKLYSVGIDINF
jgi:TonB-linked SusC/RagA family outer membrane protein